MKYILIFLIYSSCSFGREAIGAHMGVHKYILFDSSQNNVRKYEIFKCTKNNCTKLDTFYFKL